MSEVHVRKQHKGDDDRDVLHNGPNKVRRWEVRSRNLSVCRIAGLEAFGLGSAAIIRREVELEWDARVVGADYNERMDKVYLETSFFSACVSKRQTAKSAGWRASSLEWWERERRFFDVCISTEVTSELGHADFPEGEEALAMLRGIRILETRAEVQPVASLLVDEKVMPGPAISGDALHVAFAIVHRIDYILTWNIRHLANPNKRVHLGAVCLKLGVPTPQLVTPDMLKGSVGNG